MAHVHFALELGSGLGHMARAAPLAAELGRRGHDVSISTRDLVASRSAWLPIAVDCVQAPVFLHRTVGLPKPAASLAEIALGFGYWDGDILDALVEGWRALLTRLAADIVVADFSPSAVLAARSLGLPAIGIGVSFTVPPAGRPLPSCLPGMPLDPGRLEAAEARMLRSANHTLRATKAGPVTLACELFRGERALLCTWPELDCYGRGAEAAGDTWCGEASDPGTGVAPRWPPGGAPRAFAYLKGGYPGLAGTMRALAQGFLTVCYVPDVEAGREPPLVDPAIVYSDKPVNLDAAFAGASVCVCHAGVGTICRSLLAGVPLLMLPMIGEQGLNALAVQRIGAGIALPPTASERDIASALARVHADPAMRASARAFAARHRDFTSARQLATMSDEIERELAAK